MHRRAGAGPCAPTARNAVGSATHADRDTSCMPHPYWPLFNLRVRTPRLEVRYVDDELAVELATVAAGGVHEPSFMPFAIAWTDVAPPALQRETLKWFWHCRAGTSPASWHLPLAVIVGGEPSAARASAPPPSPWCARSRPAPGSAGGSRGRGIGTEMRAASLHLGFAGSGCAGGHDPGVRRQRSVARGDRQARLRAAARVVVCQAGANERRRPDRLQHAPPGVGVGVWRTDITIDGLPRRACRCWSATPAMSTEK